MQLSFVAIFFAIAAGFLWHSRVDILLLIACLAAICSPMFFSICLVFGVNAVYVRDRKTQQYEVARF